ncbi:MAG: InlB B-repeat-containing protein [Candidatus Spyradocola sp.]
MNQRMRLRTLCVVVAVLLCVCIPIVAHAAANYTVTYVDGLYGNAFTTTVYSGLSSGAATPELPEEPSYPGYTFDGWEPERSRTVTDHATYVAKWKVQDTPVYTVVYLNGQGDTLDVLYGLPQDSATPAYSGGTPTWPGYRFTGWYPGVSERVTAYAVYTAQWEPEESSQPEPTADENVSPLTGASETSLPALVIVALAAAALMVLAFRKRSA